MSTDGESSVRVAPEMLPWQQPIRDRHWIDSDGNYWRMRGDRLIPRQARRLLARKDLLVLYAYDDLAHVLEGDSRRVLLDHVDAFLNDDPLSARYFEFADFRNQRGQVMLVVQESC